MNILIITLISLTLFFQSNFFRNTDHLDTSAQQPPITNGGLPVISPDGSKIAFSSNRNGNDDLYVIGVNGSSETQLTHTPGHESIAGWTADSKQVLFSVFENNTSSIYETGLAGKNNRLIATVPGRNPVLSPDNKQLIYTTGTWTKMALLRSALDGSRTQQVNDGESIAWNIHWSRDGKRFAFTGKSDPKAVLAVFVANADGSDRHQVSRVPLDEGGAQCPAWSSDGRQLAVQVNSRLRKSSAHVWLVDVGSGESRKLAPHAEDYLDETPSWFPDGKHIAFQSNRTGRMEVWIMNVDGTNPRQVTH
jgi:TolB protein